MAADCPREQFVPGEKYTNDGTITCKEELSLRGFQKCGEGMRGQFVRTGSFWRMSGCWEKYNAINFNNCGQVKLHFLFRNLIRELSESLHAET